MKKNLSIEIEEKNNELINLKREIKSSAEIIDNL